MPGDDEVASAAVRDSLLLSELREYSERARHLSFGRSMRRAIVDALADAAKRASAAFFQSLSTEPPALAVRWGADDV
jgi:cytochrome c553